MLFQGAGRRLFSVLVMLVFVTQSFSPFAFAVDASPSPSSTPDPASKIDYPSNFASESCTVNSLSDQQRKLLWDNTLGKPINEFTDIPLESALNAKNNPFQDPIGHDAPLSPEVSSKLNLPQQEISLELVSFWSGIPKKDLVEKYVKDYDSAKETIDEAAASRKVTVAQGYEIAKSKGGTAQQGYERALRSLGLLPEAEKELPKGETYPCEGMKITLPGSPGREISCPQLMAQFALKLDSCLLNVKIKGRVSYEANLDKDLYYGNPSNDVLQGKDYFSPLGGRDPSEPEDPVAQHIIGSEIAAFLSLNGGGNILIPSYFEEWTRHISKLNAEDFKFSFYVTAGSFIAGSTAKGAIGVLQHRLDNLEKVTGKIAISAGGAQQAAAAAQGGQQGRLRAVWNFLSGSGRQADLQEQVTEATGAALRIQRHVQGLETIRNTLGFTGSAFLARQAISISLGMGWLGTARLLYEVSDKELILISGNGTKYVKVYANKPVATQFRQDSSPWNLGKILEKVGVLTEGKLVAPEKAFHAGIVRLINIADESQNTADQSLTSLSSTNGIWNIQTTWKGTSYSVNFEDTSPFKDTDEITSLQLKTNNAFPRPVIDQKNVKVSLTTLASQIAVPYIISQRIFGYSNLLGVGGALLGAQMVLQEPLADPEELCTKKHLDRYKKLYQDSIDRSRGAILWQIPLNLISALGWANPLLSIGAVLAQAFLEYKNVFAQAEQFRINAEATDYVSTCKDQQYKILAYQKLQKKVIEDEKAKTQKSQNILSNFNDALQSATKNLFSAQETPDQKLSKAKEILNFKAQITDQTGTVQSKELFSLHVEKSAWMMKGGLYDQLSQKGGCFENLATSDGVIVAGKDGIKKVNKDGSVAFDFNGFYDKLRAVSLLRSQELARTIIPNTVLTTVLACGEKPFIKVNVAGSSSLVDKSCPAGDCLTKELKKLTSFDGTNLEAVFGRISSIDTELGSASFLGNGISFVRTSIGSEKPGTETRTTNLEDLARRSGLGGTTQGASLEILGNGKAVLHYGADNEQTKELGTLKTIFADKGKIEFDPAANRLYVFLYVLGETKAQTIADVTAKASTVNSNGKTIPVINLDVRGKTGFEDVAKQLQDALKKIQQDSSGGKGGMQVFETPDKIFYLTEDGKLRVIDKKTGQAQDFKITGQPFTDANGNVVFPTDKGNIAFGTGLNAQGQPIINVNGAGLKDSGILEAAKGPGGIFTFNPSTGAITVYNGQDLPMDPRFATQGISFVGTPEGTRGIPAVNPFSLPPSDDGSFQRRRSNLTLPAWPTEAVWFAAMLGVLLIGVLFVRTRRFED